MFLINLIPGTRIPFGQFQVFVSIDQNTVHPQLNLFLVYKRRE